MRGGSSALPRQLRRSGHPGSPETTTDEPPPVLRGAEGASSQERELGLSTVPRQPYSTANSVHRSGDKFHHVSNACSCCGAAFDVRALSSGASPSRCPAGGPSSSPLSCSVPSSSSSSVFAEQLEALQALGGGACVLKICFIRDGDK